MCEESRAATFHNRHFQVSLQQRMPYPFPVVGHARRKDSNANPTTNRRLVWLSWHYECPPYKAAQGVIQTQQLVAWTSCLAFICLAWRAAWAAVPLCRL